MMIDDDHDDDYFMMTDDDDDDYFMMTYDDNDVAESQTLETTLHHSFKAWRESKTHRQEPRPKITHVDHILNDHNDPEYINTVDGFHILYFLLKRNDESQQARPLPKLTHTSLITNDCPGTTVCSEVCNSWYC